MVAFRGMVVTLEHGGLLPALQTLIAWSRDSYNIDVRLRVSMRSPLIIGESAAAHLYLIAQEAINNAVRHGNARSIAVTLRANRVLVSLSITDDGVGIAEKQARGAGMGLKLMQYRSATIGGVMRIKRLPQGGTRIHSVCPQDFAAAGAPPLTAPASPAATGAAA
jgi:two-component system sensor kinase FixL